MRWVSNSPRSWPCLPCLPWQVSLQLLAAWPPPSGFLIQLPPLPRLFYFDSPSLASYGEEPDPLTAALFNPFFFFPLPLQKVASAFPVSKPSNATIPTSSHSIPLPIHQLKHRYVGVEPQLHTQVEGRDHQRPRGIVVRSLLPSPLHQEAPSTPRTPNLFHESHHNRAHPAIRHLSSSNTGGQTCTRDGTADGRQTSPRNL